MSKQLSYSEWFIADHQIKAQIMVVANQIIHTQLEMGMDAPQVTWNFIDGLQSLLRGLKKTQRELDAMRPAQGKFFTRQLDNIRIKIYLWSIQGRLTIDREN